MPWETAWQQALYGERGFYRQDGPAAHFATSAHGIPGGGRVLAEAVARLARAAGCTSVVDVGCGRGELLAELRRVAPALHLTGVDVVERPEGLDVDAWLASPGGAALPAELRDLTRTLVLAHEWLDVVPCPVVARDEAAVWREVLAVPETGGVWGERPGDPLGGEDLAWAERWLADDRLTRAEIGLPRDRAAADLLSRVRSGLVVVVDYGHTTADRPGNGTLTGFRSGREVEPVPDGRCDVTAHVAVDALAATLQASTGRAVEPQRQWEVLRELLDDPTEPVPHALASSDPAAYLAAVARRSALTALTTGALGDFWWLVAEVDAEG